MQIKFKIQKLICYSVFINKNLNILQPILSIVKIINALILILAILEKQIIPLLNNHTIKLHALNLYNILYGNDVDGHKMEQIGYLAIALFIIFILCIILVLLLDINFFQISKHQNPLIYFFYFPIIVIIVSEISYCSLCWFYISYFIDINEGRDNYGINLIGFVFFILMSFYCMNVRLYSIFLFPVCSMIKLLKPIVAIIFFILLAIASNYTKTNVVQRLIQKSIVIVVTFKVLQQYLNQNKEQNFIYLACSLISLIIITISNREKPQVTISQVQLNKLLIKYVQELDQSPPACLSKKRKILFNSVISTLLFKQKDMLIFEMDITSIKKGINFMTFPQLIKLLDIKFRLDSQQTPQNIQLKQCKYKFRIKNQYKVHQTISKISQLLTNNIQYINKPTWKQIYFKKYLQIQIFQEFLFKYGTDVAKINHLLQASLKQQKFIHKSMLLYSHLNNFWNQINHDVLIQKTIENVLISILKEIKQLKILYKDLINVYNPLWEYEVLKIFIKLIEPSHIDYSQFENQTTSKKPNKQTMLIIFVLRNKIVIQSSSSFQKTINVSNAWIHNQNLDKITPKSVSKLISRKQSQIIQKGFYHIIIPFLSQNSTISVHNVQMKLLPKPNLAIEYLCMLHPYEKMQNQAFIFINSTSLNIKHISQQFYEIFKLKKGYPQFKILSQELYLNDIITNYQPSQIYNELIQKKTLRCNFNLKKIKNKSQSIYLYNGNITFIANYGDQTLISIILIDHEQPQERRRFSSMQKKGTQMNFANISLDKRSQMFKMISFIDQENTKVNELPHKEKIEKTKKSKKHLKSYKSVKSQKSKKQQNKIFCPIINPYKQKIQQKQVEISTQGTNPFFSFSNCLIFLTLLLACFFLVFPFVIISLTSQQVKQIQKSLTSLDNSYFSINYLLYNTFQVYYQYFLCENKQYFSQFGSTFPHQNTNSTDFSQMMNKIYYQVKVFENTTLKNFGSFEEMKSFQQPYKLKFKNFTINANFANTNLLDYLFNVKLASERIKLQLKNSQDLNITFKQAQTEQNPLEFLISNYQTIANLKSPFLILQGLKQKIYQNLTSIIIFITIACITYLFIIFGIWFAIYKFMNTLKDIFSIFSFTSKTDITQRFNQLQQISKIYIQQIPQDNLQTIKTVQQKQQKKQQIMITYAKNKFIQNQYQSIQTFNNNNPKIIINKNKHFKFKPLYIIFQLLSITFIYIIIASIIFNSMLKFKKYQQLFLIYMDQLKVLKNAQINSSTQMMHFVILRTVFNQHPDMIDAVNVKKSSVDQTIAIGFDDYFYQYYEKQNQILRSDFCVDERGVVTMGYSQLLLCKLIGSGILSQGFVQSKQYSDKIKFKIKQGLIFPQTIPQGQVYPAIMLHINIKGRIIQHIDDMIDALKQNHNIQTNKHSSKIHILAISCFGVFLVYQIYLPTKFFPLVFSIKNISFAYFKMLSHHTFGNIQVSAYIHQKQILHRVLTL